MRWTVLLIVHARGIILLSPCDGLSSLVCMRVALSFLVHAIGCDVLIVHAMECFLLTMHSMGCVLFTNHSMGCVLFIMHALGFVLLTVHMVWHRKMGIKDMSCHYCDVNKSELGHVLASLSSEKFTYSHHQCGG